MHFYSSFSSDVVAAKGLRTEATVDVLAKWDFGKLAKLLTKSGL